MRLQDQRHAAHGGEGAVDIAAKIAKHALALAVITQAAGLQHAVAAEFGEGRGKVGVIVHRKEIRCGYADAVKEALFGEAVLADLQRPGRREDGNVLGKPAGGGDRHVLELIGDDGREACQFGERLRVVIGGDDLPVGELRGGAIGLRLEYGGAVAEPGGGQRQHAPELAAADNADRRA